MNYKIDLDGKKHCPACSLPQPIELFERFRGKIKKGAQCEECRIGDRLKEYAKVPGGCFFESVQRDIDRLAHLQNESIKREYDHRESWLAEKK